MDSRVKVKSAIIVGSYGNLDQRVTTYGIARTLAEKIECKVIVVWPKNKKVPDRCPWAPDGAVAEVRYFDEMKHCKGCAADSLDERKQKVLDKIYYEFVNSGKYGKIYNLLNTSENVFCDFESLEKQHSMLGGVALNLQGLSRPW